MKIFAYALREFDELPYFIQIAEQLGIKYGYTSDYPSLENAHLAKGYEAVSPLSEYEKSLLPVFSILRRIEISAWCASHYEIPFNQQNAAKVTAQTEKLAQDFIDGVYLRPEAYEAKAG